jgi:hypothetical protein
VDTVRMHPNQLLEGLDVAPGGAKGQPTIPAARSGAYAGGFGRAGRGRVGCRSRSVRTR